MEHDALLKELTTLTTEVRGINRRLDISNGRIAKNENNVMELQKQNINILNRIDALTGHVDQHIQENDTEKVQRRSNTNKWFDRLVVAAISIVGFLALELLIKSGTVTLGG